MSGPSIFGLPPFKLALAVEIIGNLVTIPPLLFYPRTTLGWLLANPSRDINPGSEILTQLLGALVVALTAPLIVSVPSPNGYYTFRGRIQQRGFRAATYVVLGAGEIAFSMLLGGKLLAASRGQDVGLTEKSLWMGLGTMISILPMRAFFLFGRRDLLEERDENSEDDDDKKDL